MRKPTLDTKSAFVGLVFIGVATLFFVYSTTTLNFGSARNMGPGYFPGILSALLAVLGAAAIFGAIGRGSEGDRLEWPPVRAALLVLLAPVAFAIAIEPLGLVLSVSLIVLMTAGASRKMTLKTALALLVLLPMFCVLVFKQGLGVPVPLFGDALTEAFPFLPTH